MVELGVPLRGMYLIVHGTASILDSSGKVVGTLAAQDTYGESGLKESRRAAQQVQANAFLDVYILAQQQFADACKRVRVQVETAFDWDKVENVCMAQDVEPDAKAIEGVPSSELEVRDLRSKCAEQEELITGLLESIEKLSSLREYTPADREAE